ncbi:hypothetical protein BH20ACT10_BH20ACT10_12190 [soil metagenome]|jgi:hypothetical protein
MRIERTHTYFHESREKHGMVTEGIARSVAAHKRPLSFPPRRRDGRVEIFGYHPPLGAWVLVIVSGDELFNAYVEWDHKEEIAKRLRQRRR